MLVETFKAVTAGHEYKTQVSYDIVNNFTDESIIKHLNETYGCNVIGITGDPGWYGRGTVYGSNLDTKGPINDTHHKPHP